MMPALILSALLLSGPASPSGEQGARQADVYEVDLLSGRAEARVQFRPGDGGATREKIFTSTDGDRTLRVEPGNSYLLPESLWDRFMGNRSGRFRIVVRARADEAVLASGRPVGPKRPIGEGYAESVFDGGESDRGVGLFIVARSAGPDGRFPAPPAWATDELPAILALYDGLFGARALPPPAVVIMDFPAPLAKSFPAALVLDARVSVADLSPPAGKLAVLAHEAAHLWWGNQVALGGEGAATLQEGLAELGACRALGAIVGPQAEAARWRSLREEYLLASQAIAAAGATLMDEGPQGAFGRAVRYARSALVLRMLEARIGEEPFRRALATLAASSAPVSWPDLMRAAREAAGIDLSAFHEAWIFGSGHPHLVAEPGAEPGAWQVRNDGSGPGEIPLRWSCAEGHATPVTPESGPEETPRFVSLPPRQSRQVHAPGPGCRPLTGTDEIWLDAPRGPNPSAGLSLARAWGHPVVQAVAAGSRASRAGLLPGDLILAAAGRPLAEDDIPLLTGQLQAGSALGLRIRRGTREMDVQLEPSVP